jgi:hypothetical protein
MPPQEGASEAGRPPVSGESGERGVGLVRLALPNNNNNSLWCAQKWMASYLLYLLSPFSF